MTTITVTSGSSHVCKVDMAFEESLDWCTKWCCQIVQSFSTSCLIFDLPGTNPFLRMSLIFPANGFGVGTNNTLSASSSSINSRAEPTSEATTGIPMTKHSTKVYGEFSSKDGNTTNLLFTFPSSMYSYLCFTSMSFKICQWNDHFLARWRMY